MVTILYHEVIKRYKKSSIVGLCDFYNFLKDQQLIDRTEYNLLKKDLTEYALMNDLNVTGFIWPEGEKTPRLKWLLKQKKDYRFIEDPCEDDDKYDVDKDFEEDFYTEYVKQIIRHGGGG